jgi:hypothetical protein
VYDASLLKNEAKKYLEWRVVICIAFGITNAVSFFSMAITSVKGITFY